MQVFTAVSIHIKKHVLAQNNQAPLFMPKLVINYCKIDGAKNNRVYNNLSHTVKNPVSVQILWLNSHHTAPMFYK